MYAWFQMKYPTIWIPFQTKRWLFHCCMCFSLDIVPTKSISTDFTSMHMKPVQTASYCCMALSHGFCLKTFDPDVIWTRNLLIWSQTRYRGATESELLQAAHRLTCNAIAYTDHTKYMRCILVFGGYNCVHIFLLKIFSKQETWAFPILWNHFTQNRVIYTECKMFMCVSRESNPDRLLGRQPC